MRIATQITGAASKTRTDVLKNDRSAATLVATDHVLDAIREHRANFPTGIDGSIFTHNGGLWAQGTYRRVFH
ncbi:MAG: hypothetical protein ACXV3F_08020 [Frankiaceae bacterium]